MVLTIIISFISLIGLVVLHELGHFVLAKKFGVKVEEFGIGFPPRLFGKKFGETIYSINLLPLGAFVRMPGETEASDDPNSFFKQAVWKRAIIVFGGCLTFWIVSMVIFISLLISGMQIGVSDNDSLGLKNQKVLIEMIAKNSPALEAGIKPGDSIKKLIFEDYQLSTSKVSDIQQFTNEHKGEEVTMQIERDDEVLEVSLIPRVSPPNGEGAMGVSLSRVANVSTWYWAILKGPQITFDLTIQIIKGWASAIYKVATGTPSGVQVMGPVGIFNLFTQASTLGINYFLQFVAMISIYMAVFNILPIPSVDGGKLMFLAIEAVRRKPVSIKVEQIVTSVFFFTLIALMLFVTVKDIIRIF